MSKHARKKSRRRKLARRLRHSKVTPAGPEAALAALAQVLNACEGVGVSVRMRHGIVVTRYGYVLQIPDGGKWEPRSLLWAPFAPPEDDDGEEDED